MNLMFSLSKNDLKDFVGKMLQFARHIFDASQQAGLLFMARPAA
jgi:hypothetical protein